MTDIVNWLNMMERLGEADTPIITVAGVSYTPREIVRHALANDQIWQQIKPYLNI